MGCWNMSLRRFPVTTEADTVFLAAWAWRRTDTGKSSSAGGAEGWRYAGFVPKKQRAGGFIESIELIFEREQGGQA